MDKRTHVSDIMDVEALEILISDKYITSRSHPNLPLVVLNYSPKAAYERLWTPETTRCRGLVVDEEGYVVARPFPKFFNLEELEKMGIELPREEPEVYEKMDGSLFVVSTYNGKGVGNTRGSFTSEQAYGANDLLARLYHSVEFDPEYTYLFEYIAPDNRIVVDYGGQRDLVLLAKIHTATGVEDQTLAIGAPPEWPGPIANRYVFFEPKTLQEMREGNVPNREGYVLFWRQQGMRAKIKFDEYKRLHRLMTGVTARTVWEHLRREPTIDALVKDVPDEFYDFVREQQAKIRRDFVEVERAGISAYQEITKGKRDGGEMSRKDFAKAASRHPFPHKPLLFLLWDEFDYRDYVFDLIKPKAEKPFKEDEV